MHFIPEEPPAVFDQNQDGRQEASAASAASVLDKVGAIRDIIFGEQMSAYERRFSELEQKLRADFDALTQKIEQAITDLRAASMDRASAVESASVPRTELAGELDRLARLLRGDRAG